MARVSMFQLQGTTLEPIEKISNDARMVVSGVCLGVDDMQLLGNKALVLRTEIYPEKLSLLRETLSSIGIEVDQQALEGTSLLDIKIEYPLSIQIVSFLVIQIVH